MKKYFNSKKRNIYVVSILLLELLIIIPIIGIISPCQMSDGIPMLNRVQEFFEGKMTLGSYLYTAHGNSIHPLVYFFAFLDGVLFHSNAVFLRACVYIGMLGFAFVLSLQLYEENQSLGKNIILGFILNILVMGGYNKQLYLPFQMVLTFSRLIFSLVLFQLSKNLCTDKSITKKWVLWIVISCLVAPLHGMGMMFAGSIVYLHIITKQSWKKIGISVLPFCVYTILQLSFNAGYGEATDVSAYFIKYFNILIKCLGAYYGEVPYILLGLNRKVSLYIGMFVWLFVFFVLFFYFLKGLHAEKKIKWLSKLPDLSEQYVFLMGMLGISFLACASAATFTAARIDLIPNLGRDPVGQVLITADRYLCFSIVPYIIVLFLIKRIIPSTWLKKCMMFFLTGGMLIWVLYGNLKITNGFLVPKQKQFDLEATGLLTGLELGTDELKFTYLDFSDDWYWKDQIGVLYTKLKNEHEYLWYGMPSVNDALQENDLDIIKCTQIDLEETSQPNILLVNLECIEKPSQRYSPIINENGIVVGFCYVDETPGFAVKSGLGGIVYNRKYKLKGYMLVNYKDDENFYLCNEKVNRISDSDKMLNATGEIVCFDLTNDDGWYHGIYSASNCLLFQNTIENAAMLNNVYKIRCNGETIGVSRLETDDNWIWLYTENSSNFATFAAPNVITLYKYSYEVAGQVQCENLTTKHGWEKGVYQKDSCLVFQNNETNLSILNGVQKIETNDHNASANVVSMKKDDNWIWLYLDSDENIELFKYPQVLNIFK